MKKFMPPPADMTADADLLVKNPLIVDGNTVRILLHGGEIALIDLVDLPAVAHLRWSPDGNGYARCRLWRGGELQCPRLHRFLVGDAAKGLDVDHINGERWDCRRANLRPCSRRENGLNRRANTANRFGFKGVQQHKNGEYFVRIKLHGKSYRTGRYETADEAARAYDFLAQRFFGDFARLNFPTEKA